MLALEDRIVVRNLQNLPETAIYELVWADQESKANKIAVDLDVVLLVQSLFVFSEFVEDWCLEEGLHKSHGY